MAENNYTDSCEVCGKEYAATLNRDGSRRKAKHRLCGSKRCKNKLTYSIRIGTTERVRSARHPVKAIGGNPIPCSVAGCESHVETGGMCGKHYQRVRSHGDPHETFRGRRVPKLCAWCGKEMLLKAAEAVRRKSCSLSCSSFLKAKTRGQLVHGSKEAQNSFYNARRRALTSAGPGDAIDPVKVFERDNWMCHLCGDKTSKSKRGTTDRRAPELDHIVTLADGGSHTWGNVACSCRGCNGAKGSRSAGQIGFSFPVQRQGAVVS